MSERTGRTTRMLEAALSAAKDGRYVFVYCANARHRKLLMQQVFGMARDCKIIPDQKIYVGGGQITFELIDDGNLDFRAGQVLGAHPSCVVMADHYALEAAMPWLLAEHRRYDA